jgi:Tol biopolymer transport system component
MSRPVRVTPDGRWVATYRSEGAELARIWLKSLSGGGQRNIGEPGYWTPSWSPDGRQIVAGSAVGPQLVVLDVDGDRPARILASPGGIRARHPTFAPDGKSVVFDLVTRLYKVSLEGDSTPRELFPASAGGGYPAISPDGRWLAYISGEGGGAQLVVRSFTNASTNVRTLYTSRRQLIQPRWAKDGRELSFLEAPGTLMSVPINPGSILSWGTPHTVLTSAQLGIVGVTASPGFDLLPDGRFIIARPVKHDSTLTEDMVIVQNAFTLFRNKRGAAQ